MKKQSILYSLLFSLFFMPIFNVQAIEPAPIVQPSKSRLASLKAQFSAGIKRLRRAITIEDVETRRIVVKELFSIFKLILIAAGIGALIKYGVPYIEERVNVQGKAIAEEIRKQKQELFDAIDLRVKAMEQSLDVRGKIVADEIRKQREEILAAMDERAKAMLEAADIRAKAVTEGMDARTQALLKELNGQVKALTDEIEKKTFGIMQKIHGTEVTGLGVTARINIPGFVPLSPQGESLPQPEPTEFEYTGRF